MSERDDITVEAAPALDTLTRVIADYEADRGALLGELDRIKRRLSEIEVMQARLRALIADGEIARVLREHREGKGNP